MVVPFAAGGPMDVVGRIMATALSEQLGQQVVVENVGGGGGMTGAARVAKAAPDGYQFGLGNVGTHAVSQSLSKNPPYHVTTDFAPVALFADLSLVLVTRKDLPANNLQEFIAYARANHDKMQFASASAGSATHLGCALLNAAIGVDVTHIPYRGGGPAMQDIVAGRVDYICIDTPGVISLIRAARSRRSRCSPAPAPRACRTCRPRRSRACRASRRRTGRRSSCRRTRPRRSSQKLQAATSAAVDTPAVRERMKEIGIDPVAPERRSSAYLGTFVAAEIAKWAGPVKASGLAIGLVATLLRLLPVRRASAHYFPGSAASFSTGAQRAISSFTYLSNAAGVRSRFSGIEPPSVLIRICTPSSSSALSSAPASLSTIVRRRALRRENPGPDAHLVVDAEFLRGRHVRQRRQPLRGRHGVGLDRAGLDLLGTLTDCSQKKSTWPPIRSFIAGPVPR